MGVSSDDEGELPPSLSTKKRRYLKRSRLSSDSEDDKRKTRSSKKRMNSSNKESDDSEGCASEQLNRTPSLQTPRSSERLRRKSSQSFSLPSREKVLDAITPKRKSFSSQQKVKTLKRKLVNNFLRERSSYVSRGEGRYDSDDSGMSDFINDDSEEDEEDDTDSSAKSDQSCDGNKKDSGVCSVEINKKRCKKEAVLSSEEENQILCESDNDNLPLSELLDEKRSKKKMTPSAADPNCSESEEEFTPKLKTANKRRKIIHCSDSDEESQSAKQESKLKNVSDKRKNSDTDDELSKNSPPKSASLRPRSRRLQHLLQKQEDKHRKTFNSLLKKRQTAKLDPKERHANKKLSRDSDESKSSDASSSEEELDPLKEAEPCFEMHSSELEEDENDRDFIVKDGEMSDEGMNSDGASQFLKLLDTFTGKQQEEEVACNDMEGEDTHFRRRRKRRKRKKERKASKWRRIKMEDDSDDTDADDTAVSDMCKRYPPLHAAVLENDMPLVSKLIKEDPDRVYEIGYRKRTALHLAALEGKVELVKLLLWHGADRTAVDCYHLPAIAYALDGHPECVQLLLDHANIKNINKSMVNNLQEMNLLHFAIGERRDGLNGHNRAKCLELLFSKDKKTSTKLLGQSDVRKFFPLVAAVFAGQHECVQVLLRMGANACAYKTDDGGNILHFAVECASHFKTTWEATKDASQCLRELLKKTKLLIDQPDDNGFTPLMYACESGDAECVKLLLENGASINCVDSHGTSSLHLAAMSGDTECVQLLLNFGHQVDCVDKCGWPPLLYANFKAHESCVLALMKPKPDQVFVLGTLLRKARNELDKRRTVKVVKNVLVSLANHDAYYTVFNDFIRQNPEMLDENNYGLLQHIWRAILDFDNKRRWFLKKLSQIRGSSPYSWASESISLDIDRENVLGSAINQMGKTLGHALRNKSFHVTFKNEPGICTGPKREFFACFCKDVIDPKRGLFIVTDDAQYSPLPNAYFAKYVDKETRQDSSQSTASQSVTCTSVRQEAHASAECTDEELMSALSQTEELAVTTANNSHDDAERISEDSETAGNLLSDAHCDTANHDVSPPGGDQTTLGSCVSGDERAALADEEMKREVSTSQVASGEGGGEESTETIASAEAYSDSSHNSGPDSLSASSTDHGNTTWISCMEHSSEDKDIRNLSSRSKLKQLRFIGRMIGFAICQDLLLDLHLSKPFVKQILGVPLSHPDDLSSFDYELHKNAVTWIQENSVNDLDLSFSVDALNPWNSKPVTIDLTDDSDKKLTDDNKEEYAKLVSQFKLETSIKDEVTEFSGGLNEVIPRDFLSLFTADEFSLLINGVTKLDVQDWKKHTVYKSCSVEHDVIQWFWNIVSQLKEEEKALLMKFSTGSPCVPVGGFAALTGLSGPTKFTILKTEGLNKIPMASTCFNMLKLTSYSSEKHLKDKLLIAIRHGAEGFSFS